MRLLLLAASALPALAKKSKADDILKHYPAAFKFCMFWWCIIVFIVMGVYILDHLLYRKFGPARIDWKIEHVFRDAAERETYWAQLVDLSQWSHRHPVRQSADVRMVDCAKLLKAVAEGSGGAKQEAPAEDDDEPQIYESSPDLKDVPPGPLKPGFGLVMRHKDGAGKLAGAFFCTRACSSLAKPSEGAWRCVMETVEVGAGYPFAAGSEVTELELWPANDEDGSVRCSMTGVASVNSRFFRWWSDVQAASAAGALGMLEAIGAEIQAAKKKE